MYKYKPLFIPLCTKTRRNMEISSNFLSASENESKSTQLQDRCIGSFASQGEKERVYEVTFLYDEQIDLDF